MSLDTSFSASVWNSVVSPDSYGSAEQYYEHAFQQYKLYVESAEKISGLRSQANTFFLTLNTLLVGIGAYLYEKGPRVTDVSLNLFPLIVALTLCVIWWLLLHSYRQLNKSKFQIIDELESRLPARLYVAAEWGLLGEGRDFKRYLPFTTVEKYIPIVFAIIYLLMGAAIWWQSTH